MKKGYTDITVVLDRSGSMQSICRATIDGMNEFINGQKLVPGKCTMNIHLFDDRHEYVLSKDLQEIEPLNSETYVPRGMTALYDAIGMSIDATGERLATMKEKDRPEKVLFVIMTDGAENASRTYKHKDVAEKIKHQTAGYNWDFIYLGANQDSFAVAGSFGISAGKTLNWSANDIGSTEVFRSVGTYYSSVRERGVDIAAVQFSDEDRLKQEAAK